MVERVTLVLAVLSSDSAGRKDSTRVILCLVKSKVQAKSSGPKMRPFLYLYLVPEQIRSKFHALMN